MRTFVFPGQGSQQPGMGRAFADHPAWSLVTEASDAVGRDVGHLLLEAGADELVETRNAQLGTFVHSMVVLAALGERGVRPDAVAGHSLGEFSALCAAGVLSFADAVRLVAERGEAMQVCCTERKGTMAAVLGLDDDQVAKVCDAVTGDVWVANLNAPGQVVIAGDPEAIEAAATAARDAGAKRVMPLEVAGAFHTPFMAGAGERLGAAIDAATFSDAAVPVVANVDAAVHVGGSDWPALLRAQLVNPVCWTASVETLLGAGSTTFVEAGPGTVLTGTIKRIASPGITRLSAMTPDEVESVTTALGAS